MKGQQPVSGPGRSVLPGDSERANCVMRAMTADGPAICTLRAGTVLDITAAVPTLAHLLRSQRPVELIATAEGVALGSFCDVADNSDECRRDKDAPYLLAPIDLQAVKACGVTFANSLLERVVEEMADGDVTKAKQLREKIFQEIGQELSAVKPGSREAETLKSLLIEKGLWSQYLEVGIGPDAEIFTKAQPLSSVGYGARVGLHPRSTWNNPEPEVVLICDPRGRLVGATLGNDVNLRDFEGRSALLLGRAKDNNASCAVGPLIRLFDDDFTLRDVHEMQLALRIQGQDGYVLEGRSNMAEISRDPTDLVAQLFDCHQYPDGVALFTGTLFAPADDRDEPGQGFTHKLGDIVTISSPLLGTLTNGVGLSSELPPWAFGATDLFRSLAKRGVAC